MRLPWSKPWLAPRFCAKCGSPLREGVTGSPSDGSVQPLRRSYDLYTGEHREKGWVILVCPEVSINFRDGHTLIFTPSPSIDRPIAP